MTELATLDAYGVLTENATLKIQRLLPGPIERVWAYLTERELRRRWLAAGPMEMKVGAPFEFVWRNDELSTPPAQRPAGFPEEQRMQSRITELDPPRKLSFTWEGSGDVSFELDPKGNEVLLTVIHRRLPDRETLLKVAGGWHMHLDTLVARATGQEPEPFWDGWSRLKQEYDRRLPASDGIH
ncbi:SRPBCC family protein [Phyllobacterium sp. LjRoot231]|uniref:SRPBCC family protein n=1 Tax=Phyllobacterium sp. LjRoot231 TaxID=3342289 RepID=UPI003ECEF433